MAVDLNERASESSRPVAAPDRRAALQRLGVQLALGGAILGLPSAARAHHADLETGPIRPDEPRQLERGLATAQETTYDMRWIERLTGAHKAVYDSPDIGSGLGVLRAAVVKQQYMSTFGLPASAISNVIVLRHDGIVLAMTQAFWDTYGLAKTNRVTHPWTGEVITKNPATLTPADGLPARLAGADLRAQLAAGAIVLACELAFGDMVDLVAKTDTLAPAAARAKALSMMMPGIVMQPSGVFATTVAQEKGCIYVRAS